MKKQKLILTKNKQCILAIVLVAIILATFMPRIYRTNLGNVFLGLVVLAIFYCNQSMAIFAGLIFAIFIVYMRFIMSRLEGYVQMTPETANYLSIKNGKVVASSPIAANTGAPLPMVGTSVPQVWTNETQNAIMAFGAKQYPKSTTFSTVFSKRYNTATDSEVKTYLSTGKWPWTQDTTNKFKKSFVQHYTKNGGKESDQSDKIMNVVIETSKMQLTNNNATDLANNLDMYSIWVQYMVYLAKGGKE